MIFKKRCYYLLPALVQGRVVTRGFTLIEVIVALAIFGILLASVPMSYIVQMRFNTHAENTFLATSAAETVLDALRMETIKNLPSHGDRQETLTINSKDLEVITEFCKNSKYCDSATRHISIKVLLNEKVLYTVETVYTQLD